MSGNMPPETGAIAATSSGRSQARRYTMLAPFENPAANTRLRSIARSPASVSISADRKPRSSGGGGAPGAPTRHAPQRGRSPLACGYTTTAPN